jgi:hypothetical protein
MSRTGWIIALLSLFALSAPAFPADVSVSSDLVQELTVAPGGAAEGEIVVMNHATAERQVRVYQTDYLFDEEGRNQFNDPGTDPRSNAAWVTVAPRLLTVPPLSTARVSYTVNVPNKPGLVGTYWSIVMVEPMAQLAPAASADAKPGLSVQVVVRYGVQVVTHIGDTGKRDLQVAAKQLVTTESGGTALVAGLTNAGERALRPTLWSEVYDESGAQVKRVDLGASVVYPGCSLKAAFDFGKLSVGRYSALIVADNGDDNVFGARAKLEVK